MLYRYYFLSIGIYGSSRSRVVQRRSQATTLSYAHGLLSKPARPRPVVERRLPRKLWLGDRGVLQPRVVGKASALSADEQFAGWQEALPPPKKAVAKSSAA